MNIDEFMVELAKTKDDLQWGVEIDDYALRATAKDGDKRYCPITAVTERVTGRFYKTYDHWTAAEDVLGMTFADAQSIVHATDRRCGHDQDIRKRLIKATNVRERRSVSY